MSEKLESVPYKPADTINVASVKDSAALASNQARLHNIQQIQKRNRELRDNYGVISLPDGRGIKSASAISSIGKPNTTRRHSAPNTPQIVDLSGDPDARDLGGTFGEDFGPSAPVSLKPWETAKGEKEPQYKTKEFKKQWFTDQMKELGYDYDPKYYLHAYSADYKRALAMAESNWKAMSKEWDAQYQKSQKTSFQPVAATSSVPPAASPVVPSEPTTPVTSGSPAAPAASPVTGIISETVHDGNTTIKIGDVNDPISSRSHEALKNFEQARASERREAKRVAAVGRRVAGTDHGVWMSDGGIYFGDPGQNPDKRKSKGALV